MTTTTTRTTPPAPVQAKGSAGVRVRGASSRRTPWVAVGVVLIVAGALAVGLLVQSAGRRSAVVVAAADIAPGQVIEPGDLRVVDAAIDGTASVVPAARGGELVGQTATSRIPAGSLVSPGQFSTGSGLAAGRVVVGVLLGPGGLPVPNLRVGDRVRLVEARDAERLAGAAGAVGEASVFLVTPGTQPGTQFVSLAVGEDVEQRVVDAAAAQRLRLVLLPAADEGDG